MKKRNWLFYFLYAIALLGYIFISNKILIYVNTKAETTFNMIPSLLYSMVISIVLGMLLGLEHLLMEKKKEGRWRINVPKIVLLGLPFFYFSFGILLYFIPINFFLKQYLTDPFLFLSKYLSILRVIFGYIFVSCFYKENTSLIN